jgi:hypothetical protein
VECPDDTQKSQDERTGVNVDHAVHLPGCAGQMRGLNLIEPPAPSSKGMRQTVDCRSREWVTRSDQRRPCAAALSAYDGSAAQ